MHNAVFESATTRCATGVVCTKEDGVKAAAPAARVEMVARVNFIVLDVFRFIMKIKDIFCETSAKLMFRCEKKKKAKTRLDFLPRLTIFC